MAAPPVIIIIGPHAYHFANQAEALAFLSKHAS